MNTDTNDNSIAEEWYRSLDVLIIIVVYPILNLVNLFVLCRISCLLSRKGMSPNTMKSFKKRYIFTTLFTIPFYLSSVLHEMSIRKIWIFN